jgi:hypothetical protein
LKIRFVCCNSKRVSLCSKIIKRNHLVTLGEVALLDEDLWQVKRGKRSSGRTGETRKEELDEMLDRLEDDLGTRKERVTWLGLGGDGSHSFT